MASFVQYQGGGAILDREMGVITLAGTDLSGTVATKLLTILHGYCALVATAVGTSYGTIAQEVPALQGTSLVGTATGTSAGFVLGTTPATNAATFVRAGSAAGNASISFFYCLEGSN